MVASFFQKPDATRFCARVSSASVTPCATMFASSVSRISWTAAGSAPSGSVRYSQNNPGSKPSCQLPLTSMAAFFCSTNSRCRREASPSTRIDMRRLIAAPRESAAAGALYAYCSNGVCALRLTTTMRSPSCSGSRVRTGSGGGWRGIGSKYFRASANTWSGTRSPARMSVRLFGA